MYCPKCGYEPGRLDIFGMLELAEEFKERDRWQKDPEHRKTLEFYAWFISGFENARVLDVGAGPGTVAVPLSLLENVSEIVCFDQDTTTLEELERVARKLGSSRIKIASDGQPWNLTFENESFDVVVCRYAMHHFENQHGAFLEFHRCLKPGGILLYSDPAMPPHSRDTTHGLYCVRQSSFYGYRTYHEMLELLGSASLQMISIRSYDYQRGTLDDYLGETESVLREPLTRAWLALDERTKLELKWLGRRDGAFITYPIIDIAASRSF